MVPERRKSSRRDDDQERELADSMEHDVSTWLGWVIRRRALLFSIGGLMGSSVTIVATAFAMRYTDPAKQVNAVRILVDSNVIPRLSRVEQGVVDGRDDRARMNRRLDWLVYMNCREFVDRHPAEFRPDICNEGKPK